MVLEREEKEQNHVHGTDRLNKYHWGDKYEVLSGKEIDNEYEFKGQPPIWLGDQVELVWYFDKPGGKAKRSGFFKKKYTVSAFEEYWITDDEENPISKKRYDSLYERMVEDVIQEGDRLHINKYYNDGSLHKHRVTFSKPYIHHDGLKLYMTKFRGGNEAGVELAGLDDFVVKRIIELYKRENVDDYEGSGDMWLDESEFYDHLISCRGIPMNNLAEIRERVRKMRMESMNT